MNGIMFTESLAKIIVTWMLMIGIAEAQAVSRLSTRFLARGEQALLEIAVAGNLPPEIPKIPELNDIKIQFVGRGPVKPQPGRKIEYALNFLVSSYVMGPHVLPSFEVIDSGVKTQTEPIDFSVFNPDDLVWSEAEAGGKRFSYASTFRVLNRKPFNGETTPVEIKIYVPQSQFVEDWGNPDFQRDGLTAWRFQHSAMRGQVNLLGQPYFSVAYPSTLTPTRAGKITIGPATVRLVTTQVILDGFQRQVAEDVNLQIPKLDLESLPLPENAPEGFENAVGNFRMTVNTATTEVMEGDPIALDIEVKGSGNLDTLRPPKPLKADGWKIYEATTDQRGDERRELSGTSVFRQFIRPLEIKTQIPAFRLVFFDPKTRSYETLVTTPISLQMKPAIVSGTSAIASPKALPIPVERMTDILGLLNSNKLTESPRGDAPQWILHLIGSILALGLLIKAMWMRYGHRFFKDPILRSRMIALREIERMNSVSDIDFLLAVGRYIETRLNQKNQPDVQGILAERDSYCFLVQKPSGAVLAPKRRETILRILRNASLSCLAIFVIGEQHAVAGDIRSESAIRAYEEAKYEEAIALWLGAGNYETLTSNTLYNIGNACYRAGSPGHAALYFRRAINRNSNHQESRQNLRFIERKYGSITVHRPDYQYAIARVPLTIWKNITWSGLWICTLALLIFPATRRGTRVRIVAILALLIAPFLITCGSLGWHYFPSDAEFVSVERQAVIIGDKVVVHSQASRTSPEVIDAPPGSLCEVIQHSGRWVYIAFASQTRGWVPAEFVEKVQPSSPPTSPKIKKPKADEKSA